MLKNLLPRRTVKQLLLLCLAALVTAGTVTAQQTRFNVAVNRQIDANYSQHVSDVDVTFDGGYIAVTGNAGLSVCKFSQAGSLQWTCDVAWGSGIYYARDVVQLKDSGYAVTGTGGPGYTPSSSWEIAYMRLDKNGALLWVKTYNGVSGGFSMGSWIEQTMDGGLIIGGQHESKGVLIRSDINGNLLWTKSYDGITRIRTGFLNADSSFTVWGVKDNSTFGIAKVEVDKNGDVLSGKAYNLTSFTHYLSVYRTDDTGYIVLFDEYGTSPVMMKTDMADNILWRKKYIFNSNSNNSRHPRGMAVVDGGYVFTGETFTYGGGYSNAMWTKVDTGGNVVWVRDYNTAYWDAGYAVEQTPDKGLVLWTSMFTNGSTIVSDLIKTDSLGNNICPLQTEPVTTSSFTITPASLTVTASTGNGITARVNSYNGPAATLYYPCPVVPGAQFKGDNLSICPGSTVNFTDQSSGTPTSWRWTFSGGTPPSSNLQNPSVVYNTAGVYNVKLVATNSNGSDSIIKSAYIQVSQSANVSILNQDTAICPGSPVNLIADGADSYSWLPVLGLSDSTGSSVTASPTGTTTYVVTGATGTCVDTASVTVAISPLANAGIITSPDDSICSGSSTALTVSGNSSSIRWQSSADGVSYSDVLTDTAMVYTTSAISQAMYYRVVTAEGCADTSVPFILGVYPLPQPSVFAADSLVCTSDSARIDCNGPFVSYLWNNGDNRSFTYVNAGGAYWVTVTDAHSCTALSNRQDIEVHPVPSVSVTLQGDTLTSFNAVSYQWLFNGTLIPGATGNMYTATQSGDYSVLVTDTNGCSAQSSSITIVVNGLENVWDNMLAVYPSPFTHVLYVYSKTNLAITAMRMYDVAGRLMWERENARLINGLYTIDASVISTGIYYLQVEADGINRVMKVLKW